eukprot:gb/GFBE01067599.1/.p1 GENE.gb/GFBE01067599.1/~~gb/GFBE01067599.1/.p1  ORF type:complete len:125 (+),score=28.66 gb/GFBE01067599.1/:1-375(+)
MKFSAVISALCVIAGVQGSKTEGQRATLANELRFEAEEAAIKEHHQPTAALNLAAAAAAEGPWPAEAGSPKCVGSLTSESALWSCKGFDAATCPMKFTAGVAAHFQCGMSGSNCLAVGPKCRPP